MDCIAKRVEAGQTDRSGCVKPHCFEPLLKGGAIFAFFEQEDIIIKLSVFKVTTLYNTNQIYYFLRP